MFIKNLQSNITKILNPSVTHNKEQRVRIIEQEQQQRVIYKTTITTIPRITNAPPIMQSRNPTAKRHLKNTPWIHQHQTQNNTPGVVPFITRICVQTWPSGPYTFCVDDPTTYCTIHMQCTAQPGYHSGHQRPNDPIEMHSKPIIHTPIDRAIMSQYIGAKSKTLRQSNGAPVHRRSNIK